MGLLAGAAKKSIDPVEPIFLSGYPHVERMSAGVNDSLYASALYLDDGAGAVIMIAVDILYVSAEQVRCCRGAISEATGVAGGDIMISATHTHSAPLSVEVLAWADDEVVPEISEGYVKLVCDGIVDAAIAAKEGAVAAVLAVTSGQADGVGGNRLSKDGVADREVGIFYLKRKSDDSPLAVAMIYCMHPTVLHEDSKEVSSDFPGYTRRLLEAELGGAVVLYFNGPCGNLSPRYYVCEQSFSEAKRLGEKLGGAVLGAIGKLCGADFSEDVSVEARGENVFLPARDFPDLEEARAGLEEAAANYEKLQREGAGHGAVRTAECVVFGAEELMTLAKAQDDGRLEAVREKHNPVEVQVVRVGESFVVAFPGEMFVEYGLEVKQLAGGKSFVVSMANGELQGYIVTPGAEGYEGSLSLFRPESGRILVDTAVGLITRLS